MSLRSKMTLATVIPFELHLTTEPLTENRIEAFRSFCGQYSLKPLLIELSRGEVIQQPMVSNVINAATTEEALSLARQLSEQLKKAGFIVKRVKIEIPSSLAHLITVTASGFQPYFESHIRINLERMDKLLEICIKHKVHLSRNALKNAGATRFVTLREHGPVAVFNDRVNKLEKDLTKGKWQIIKRENEYCVYDNNIVLDNGWLPQ